MTDIIATRVVDIMIFEASTPPARVWMGALYASTIVQFDLVQQRAQAQNFLSAAQAKGFKVFEAIEVGTDSQQTDPVH